MRTPAARATAGELWAYAPVFSQMLPLRATIRPSASNAVVKSIVAESERVVRIDSSTLRPSLTGRPVAIARAATRGSSFANDLLPNPPPMGGTIRRTALTGMPKHAATSFRTM
jgi:hypothetical protein